MRSDHGRRMYNLNEITDKRLMSYLDVRRIVYEFNSYMKSVVKLRGTFVNKVLCSVLSSLNTIFVDVDSRLNIYL